MFDETFICAEVVYLRLEVKHVLIVLYFSMKVVAHYSERIVHVANFILRVGLGPVYENENYRL